MRLLKTIFCAMLVMMGSQVTTALARGGGDFMNSPGYQRRLQESRGNVTDRSGLIMPAPSPASKSRYRPRRR